MENNDNKPREGSNSPDRKDGRKPFHKHHHHRHQNKAKKFYGNAPTNEQAGNEGVATQSAPQIVHEGGTHQDSVRGEHSKQNHRPRLHKSDRRRHQAGHTQNAESAVTDTMMDAGALPDESISDSGNAVAGTYNRQPKHTKRRHDIHRGADHQADAYENYEASASAEKSFDITDATVSEYITTAGSIDAEVIDELNSVSGEEAEMIENEESEVQVYYDTQTEAELAKYEVVGIRFKPGGKIYYFDPGEIKFQKKDPVIVETSRGLEFGICEISNRTVTEREVVLPLRTVVRAATKEDILRHESNVAHEKEAFAICSQKILDHKLGMKLIDVEYAFDASKLLFYFTAEGRVDFRELVKDLAAVFRTRIELRQIGIRDETKLLGGIGICGRPFCCKTFLQDFVQVSIKMAKEQNLSLNSVKISGACGRLMCCLRYEYDTYQEEIKKTPKVDQIVATPDGEGTVIEVQPLAGLVRVRFGAKTDMIPPKVYHRDDVKVIGGKGIKPKDSQPEQ